MTLISSMKSSISTDFRLMAHVQLQTMDPRRRFFKDIGAVDLDVTEDVLALDFESLVELFKCFDADKPAVEHLPGPLAKRWAELHDGPSEVRLPLTQFFQDLDLAPAGSQKWSEWLTIDVWNKAREHVLGISPVLNASPETAWASDPVGEFQRLSAYWMGLASAPTAARRPSPSI